MNRLFSPITRISISLVFLTISLLLAAEMVGVVPDPQQAAIQARKTIVQTLAVQLTAEIRAGSDLTVMETLSALVRNDEAVLSAGVRRRDGALVNRAGDHQRYWRPHEAGSTGVTHVRIPIAEDGEIWGHIEVRFQSLDGGSLLDRLSHSYLALVLFVGIAGAFAYNFFLKRTLRELDPSAAVPERVRNAFDVLAEGLLVLDGNGRVMHANQAFVQRLGVPLQSLVGKSASQVETIRWNTGEGGRSLPWLSVLNEGMDSDEAEVQVNMADTERRLFMVKAVAIRGGRGELRGALATFDDMTEIQRKNAELERMLGQLERSRKEISRQNEKLHTLATRDPLSGCLNRRALFDLFGRAYAEAVENGEGAACIMVDIDHFKSINDSYGHATGDVIIKLLADVLHSCIRETDFVGRYGGEEFCVALTQADSKAAIAVAERMRREFENQTTGRLEGRKSITASLGVAVYEPGIKSVEQLVDCADKALYLAKRTGRNRVALWTAEGARNCQAVDSGVGSEPLAKMPAPHTTAEPDGEAPSSPTPAGPHAVDAGHLVFMDRIRQGMERAQRHGHGIGVMVVGLLTARRLDGTVGYPAREKLLDQARRRISQTLRGSDSVARIRQRQSMPVLSRTGDHELAVLLNDLGEDGDATWAIHRVVAAFEQPFEVEGYEIYVDVSIGVSLYPQDGESPDQLVRFARAARIEAEDDHGAATYRFYSREIDQVAHRQLQIVSDLHKALDRNEFFLEYQPIVNLAEGRITALEALVRWQHPRFGRVGPDGFIAEAEHAGLIGPLGERVLESACGQLEAWRRIGYMDLSIGVNLSPLQFRDPRLAARVLETVDGCGLPRECVTVELTESAVMDNLDLAILVTGEFSDAGLRIAIDDFGTGYSSFGYLSQFSFDKLKIDRSFIVRAARHAPDAAIVDAIVSVGHSLGLKVVAEGVETPEHLQLCRALGCDEIQGYLVGRPMPAHEVSELLAMPHRTRELLQVGTPPGRAAVLPIRRHDDPLDGVLNKFTELHSGMAGNPPGH